MPVNVPETPTPSWTQTYERFDPDYQGPGLGDPAYEEEELLKRTTSELGTITQVLINMLIFMSQGGQFGVGGK